MVERRQQQTVEKVLEALDFYRSLILDSVEQEFADSPRWPYLRSRLLRALGDRGLANQIREIMAGGEERGTNKYGSP